MKTPSSHSPLLGLSFTPNSSTSSSQAVQGDGEWGLRSVHDTLPLPLLPPHTLRLRQRGPFPWAAVFHEQLQHGVLPMGHSPSDTDFSSVGPQWGHESCWKSCSSVGSSPQATAPARGLLQCGLSTGCSFFQCMSTCSSKGSSMGCR